MFSLEETMQHLGCSRRQVTKLVKWGHDYGRELHPRHGGLWPTFKLSHKCRRVPLCAIERHKRHQARVHGEGLMIEAAA